LVVSSSMGIDVLPVVIRPFFSGKEMTRLFFLGEAGQRSECNGDQ